MSVGGSKSRDETYLRVENLVDSLSTDLADLMEASIERFILKYGQLEVNGSKAEAYVLKWKESSSWVTVFTSPDARIAFSIFLNRYMQAREADWKDGVRRETAHGWATVYERK